jgi:hypothetical protein
MALPNTGITTTLVGNTIGSGSGDVGTLFLHPNVNEWGFNCPGINNMKAVWGKPPSERQKLSPNDPNYVAIPFIQPGYNLGYFRGYDHDWVTYAMTMGSFERSSYSAMSTTIGIARPPKLLTKPNPYPNVFIDFKIEFARILTDFNNGTATIVDNAAFTEENAPYTLTIDGKYPPDKATNGILAEGATFYVKITPINPPERRLIDAEPFILSAQMVADTTPIKYIGVRDFNIVAVKTAGGVNIFTMSALIYANYSAGWVRNVSGQMADNSDFSGYVSTSGLTDVQLTLSGDEYSKEVSFDFSSFMGSKGVIVGDTVFGRISIPNGACDGGSTVVVSELPR